jgi:hypothetical protein
VKSRQLRLARKLDAVIERQRNGDAGAELEVHRMDDRVHHPGAGRAGHLAEALGDVEVHEEHGLRSAHLDPATGQDRLMPVWAKLGIWSSPSAVRSTGRCS